MTKTNWKIPPKNLTISKNEIHIWKVLADSQITNTDYYYSLLSEDEKLKADRYYFKKDRDSFKVARGVLRILLGKYLEISPKKLCFTYSAHGKPFIRENTKGFYFNLSHSHNLVLYAFGFVELLGVDVEFINNRTSYRELAKRFFSKNEISQIFSLPEEEHKAAFFNCWSRKEAYIKAKGKGLAIPLGNFSVNVLQDEARLLISEEPEEDVSKWLMKELDTESGYAAAFAVKTEKIEEQCFLFI